MSDSWISLSLRRRVGERAGFRCEYCGIRESDTYLGCQIDHVVSEKHGGATIEENLAMACTFCNRAKGSDIAGLDDEGRLVPLFNPRTDRWLDHFRTEGTRIIGVSSVGSATVRLLKFNELSRLDERRML